jgi:phosphoglycerate dehydrogenase-like enzyme
LRSASTPSSEQGSSAPLTVLVIGNPAAEYLKPLAALPSDTRVVISRDRDQLKQAAPDADVILNADFRDPSLLLETFPLATRVRWVHALSAGVEKLLSPEIVESSVPLTNGRGLYQRTLGEWIVAAMLYFAYDLRRVIRNQQAGRWEPFEHQALYGRTLGIIGYGAIGRAAAQRARAFGMRILALRRNGPGDSTVDAVFTRDRLNEMLAECDYAAITAPLTVETRGMIGAAQIAAMKPSSVIINVGRGPVLDEAALIAALESKKIRGAALDVFDTEPLPAGHPFYTLENVLMSPHNADQVPESRTRAVEFFVKNFERFRAGQPLENVVDKHAGY